MTDRADTGTIKNEIVRMAASLMYHKVCEDRMIAELRQEKYGQDDRTAAILIKKAKRAEDAIDLMDEFDGCWS